MCDLPERTAPPLNSLPKIFGEGFYIFDVVVIFQHWHGAHRTKIGGAEGKVFELTLDPLELARKFAELKFSLDCIKMILSSQTEKKDGLIL